MVFSLQGNFWWNIVIQKLLSISSFQNVFDNIMKSLVDIIGMIWKEKLLLEFSSETNRLGILQVNRIVFTDPEVN